LFRWLRTEKSGLLGDAIKWNFTKFLVGRDGAVLKRYASTTAPDKLSRDIEEALAA
jgi:glutathione peroxidase